MAESSIIKSPRKGMASRLLWFGCWIHGLGVSLPTAGSQFVDDENDVMFAAYENCKRKSPHVTTDSGCFFLSSQKAVWEDAEYYCDKEGAHFAELTGVHADVDRKIGATFPARNMFVALQYTEAGEKEAGKEKSDQQPVGWNWVTANGRRLSQDKYRVRWNVETSGGKKRPKDKCAFLDTHSTQATLNPIDCDCTQLFAMCVAVKTCKASHLKLVNGKISNQYPDVNFLTAFRVQCDEGYSNPKPAVVGCLLGAWNASVATCYKDCPTINHAETHGTMYPGGTGSANGEFAVKCLKGGQASSSVVRCRNGVWENVEDGKTAICSCPRRDGIVSHGYVDTAAIGESSEIKCEEGYTLDIPDGSKMVQCREKVGDWEDYPEDTEEKQFCQPDCLRQAFKNGALLEKTPFRQSATVQCNNGGVAMPQRVACGKNGVWTDTDPAESPCKCPPIFDIVPNGHVRFGESGTTGKIECTSGYSLKKRESLQKYELKCRLNPVTWEYREDFLPNCSKDCPKKKFKTGAVLDQAPFNEQVGFRCPQGIPSDNVVMKCMENGEWEELPEKDIPDCLCSPLLVENGFIGYGAIQDEGEILCYPNYTLLIPPKQTLIKRRKRTALSSDNAQDQDDGHVNQTNDHVDQNDDPVGKDEDPVDQKSVPEDHDEEDETEPGDAEDPPYLRCGAISRNWEYDREYMPTCQPDCPEFVNKENGAFVPQTPFGQNATQRCRKGTMKKPKKMKCIEQGQWIQVNEEEDGGDMNDEMYIIDDSDSFDFGDDTCQCIPMVGYVKYGILAAANPGEYGKVYCVENHTLFGERSGPLCDQTKQEWIHPKERKQYCRRDCDKYVFPTTKAFLPPGRFGDMGRLQCLHGVVERVHWARCNGKGKWENDTENWFGSKHQPRCMCGPIMEFIPEGYVGMGEAGNVTSVICNEGHTFVDAKANRAAAPFQLFCNQTSLEWEWDRNKWKITAELSCEPFCPKVTDEQSGARTNRTDHYGQTSEVFCVHGGVPYPEFARCGRGGKREIPPKCWCLALETENGLLPNATIGSENVAVECEDGYTVAGGTKVHCSNKTGNWTLPIPICTPFFVKSVIKSVDLKTTAGTEQVSNKRSAVFLLICCAALELFKSC